MPKSPVKPKAPDSKVRQWINEQFDQVLLADGFDDALIGVGYRCGHGEIAVYDYDKAVQVLVADSDGLDEDEAAEYIDFNVVGAWVGEGTPLFIHRPPEDDG